VKEAWLEFQDALRGKASARGNRKRGRNEVWFSIQLAAVEMREISSSACPSHALGFTGGSEALGFIPGSPSNDDRAEDMCCMYFAVALMVEMGGAL